MSEAEIEIHQLKEKLSTVTAERNTLHAALTDSRLSALEEKDKDKEIRLRALEEIRTRFNTIYALFAGNGLISVIILTKLFSEAKP